MGAKVNVMEFVSVVVGENVNGRVVVVRGEKVKGTVGVSRGENVNGMLSVSPESSLESSVGAASSISSAFPFRASSSYWEVSLKGNFIHPGRGRPAANQDATGL